MISHLERRLLLRGSENEVGNQWCSSRNPTAMCWAFNIGPGGLFANIHEPGSRSNAELWQSSARQLCWRVPWTSRGSEVEFRPSATRSSNNAFYEAPNMADAVFVGANTPDGWREYARRVDYVPDPMTLRTAELFFNGQSGCGRLNQPPERIWEGIDSNVHGLLTFVDMLVTRDSVPLIEYTRRIDRAPLHRSISWSVSSLRRC
jgi:hypothetical protein